MGVDDGPQYIPQQPRQVFQEYLDAQTFNGLFQPVEGTNLTMATLSVTTVQKVASCILYFHLLFLLLQLY